MQRPDHDERRDRPARERVAARRHGTARTRRSSPPRATTRTRPTRPGRLHGLGRHRDGRHVAGRQGLRGHARSTTAAPARARASGTRGASARSSTTRRCSTGSRRSRGPTARSRRPAARTWASPRSSSPRPTPRACAQGKPRAVKAIWADVPMSDAYRDVTFHGGAVDAGFIPLWLGPDDGAVRPAAVDHDRATRPAPAPTWLDHLRNGLRLRRPEDRRHDARAATAPTTAPFYRLRSPGDRVERDQGPGRHHRRLVGHLPARRAAALRAADATRRTRSSSCRRTTTRPSGPAMEDPDAQAEVVRPLAQGRRQRRREHAVREPLPDRRRRAGSTTRPGRCRASTTRRCYLGRRQGAGFAKAPAQGGGDTTPLLPASSPCSRMTAQWTAGAAAAARARPTTAPTRRRRSPTRRAPLEKDTQLTGPIVANVWAELTSQGRDARRGAQRRRPVGRRPTRSPPASCSPASARSTRAALDVRAATT